MPLQVDDLQNLRNFTEKHWFTVVTTNQNDMCMTQGYLADMAWDVFFNSTCHPLICPCHGPSLTFIDHWLKLLHVCQTFPCENFPSKSSSYLTHKFSWSLGSADYQKHIFGYFPIDNFLESFQGLKLAILIDLILSGSSLLNGTYVYIPIISKSHNLKGHWDRFFPLRWHFIAHELF